MDASQLTISLGTALATASALLVSLIGMVVWAFSYFTSKADHEKTVERVQVLEQNWGDIKSDLSYIRGRLEPKP